jgi:hypothetical protein
MTVNEFIWTGDGLNLFELLLTFFGPVALTNISCTAAKDQKSPSGKFDFAIHSVE